MGVRGGGSCWTPGAKDDAVAVEGCVSRRTLSVMVHIGRSWSGRRVSKKGRPAHEAAMTPGQDARAGARESSSVEERRRGESAPVTYLK